TTTTLPAPLAVALAARPVAAGDPVALAEQITVAEGAVRDPATAPDVAAAAGHLQQVVYRQLGVHPEWDADVLARVPPELAESVQLNAQARRAFRSMHRRLADTLPAWRIVEPEPADVLLAHYREAEAAFGVGWHYLAAINLVETGMGRIRGTSVAGAQGPMQFMPGTWERYGEGDINSAQDSILAAARYLHANGGADPGGIEFALYRYNNHNAYVRGVMAHARVMELDPRAFVGYYHWQIYFLSAMGDVFLPVGYEATAPIPVADYLATHPQ
ncbi:MAG: lytic transglycosylase domain-containing protein, partial [Acidimicrobiales bacterium]